MQLAHSVENIFGFNVTLFHNYKEFFSLVLIAVCDADYCFTLIDIGQYDINNDSGGLSKSEMSKRLSPEEMHTGTRTSSSLLLLFPYITCIRLPMLEGIKHKSNFFASFYLILIQLFLRERKRKREREIERNRERQRETERVKCSSSNSLLKLITIDNQIMFSYCKFLSCHVLISG